MRAFLKGEGFMKRMLSLALSVCLAAGLLTACGGGKAEKASSVAASSAAATGSQEGEKKMDLNAFSHHAEANHPSVTVYKDLAYGDRRDRPDEGDGCQTGKVDAFGHGYDRHRSGQNFDLYLPADVSASSPVFVLIHGGAWCQPADKDTEEVYGTAGQLADAGYVVVSIDYMLQADLTADPTAKPYADATLDTMLRDVDTLMTYLKTFLPTIGVTPGKLAIGGGSAGGYLATAYAYDAACPDQLGLSLRHDLPVGFVLDVVGPVDLSSPQWMGAADKALLSLPEYGALFGSLVSDKTESVPLQNRLAKYSPLSMVNRNTPPTLLLYNQLAADQDPLMQACGLPSDGLVPVFTYQNMKAALTAAGVPHAGKLLQNAIHGTVDAAWIAEQVKAYRTYLS